MLIRRQGKVLGDKALESNSHAAGRGLKQGRHLATAFLARWAPSLLIILAAVGAWEGLVRLYNVQRWLLPPPSSIAQELGSSYQLLLRHAGVTLEEVLLGFAAALVIGVLVAIAIGYSGILERAIFPFVIASQTIPVIVIAPLLLIWVGYDIRPKIIVVALISFFPIVVNMVDGLRSVDADMVSMMRTLGASRWQVFSKLQFPSSLPFLFSGAKIAIAISVIGAVIGEWVGSSEGLGYLMIHSVPRFQTARVFAAIFILSVMGTGLFALVTIAERYLLPWYHTQKRQKSLEI